MTWPTNSLTCRHSGQARTGTAPWWRTTAGGPIVSGLNRSGFRGGSSCSYDDAAAMLSKVTRRMRSCGEIGSGFVQGGGEQAEGAGLFDCLGAPVGAEFGVEVAHVGFDGVYG
jgi:hypothetical protein